MVALLRGVFFLIILLSAEGARAQGTQIAPAASSDDGSALEARLAFERGLAALRAESWADAEARFRYSLRFVQRESSTYNLAFALFKQSKLQESASLLRALIDSTAPGHKSAYRGYAEELLPRVLAELSTLHLRVEPSSAQLTLDGAAVALSGAERALVLDPGAHWIEVSAPGFLSQRRELTLPEHASLDHSVALLPAASQTQAVAPAAARVPSRTAKELPALHKWGPWIMVGVGVALLVTSAVTGTLAKRADDAFVEHCPSLKDCEPQLKGEREQALRRARATDALLGSGLLLVAGGATWRVIAGVSARRAEHAWTLRVGARF